MCMRSATIKENGAVRTRIRRRSAMSGSGGDYGIIPRILGDAFGSSDDIDDDDYVPEDSEHDSEEVEDQIEIGGSAWAHQWNTQYETSKNFTAEIFERGYRFPNPMTYKELYDVVNMKHQMDGGGEPLKTKGLFKNPQDHLPYQISFYCPHGRQHVGKSEKGVKNMASKRANRDSEDRRSAYTKCGYKLNIRLDTDYVAQHNEEGDGGRGLKSLTRAKWFVDSHQDFTTDIMRRNFVSSCFCHSGHCKKTLVTGQVTELIRVDIHVLGRSCVPVASIAARVLENHKVYLTYQQIHYELCEIGLTVGKGGVIVSAQSGARKNQCEALLDWLRNEDDQMSAPSINRVCNNFGPKSERDRLSTEIDTKRHWNNSRIDY
jgi:hypothetical protein